MTQRKYKSISKQISKKYLLDTNIQKNPAYCHVVNYEMTKYTNFNYICGVYKTSQKKLKKTKEDRINLVAVL